MIYKFKFEVCNDDNYLLSAKAEESGNFWWAFTEFMYYVMTYAMKNRLPKDG